MGFMKGKKRTSIGLRGLAVANGGAYLWSLFHFCHDNVSLTENRRINRRKRRRRARIEELKYEQKE
jgi:hypothetical protein